jgi:hypothetical protein
LGAVAAALATASFLHAANTTSQADRLLNELRDHARLASSDADRVALLDRHVSWRTAAGLLTNVKGDINSMGPTLVKLESLRSDVTSSQMKQIDAAESLVREMVTSATGAIEALNEHQENYAAVGAYERYATDLSLKSERLSHSLDEYFALAKARSKEQRIEKDLGINGN